MSEIFEIQLWKDNETIRQEHRNVIIPEIVFTVKDIVKKYSHLHYLFYLFYDKFESTNHVTIELHEKYQKVETELQYPKDAKIRCCRKARSVTDLEYLKEDLEDFICRTIKDMIYQISIDQLEIKES